MVIGTSGMRILVPSPVSTAVCVRIPTITTRKYNAKPTKIWRLRDTPSALLFNGKTLRQPYELAKPEFASSPASLESTSAVQITASDNGHWMVLVKDPSLELRTKSHIINFYVSRLECILGSAQNAQRCIYHASCDTHYGFCCAIDEETALKLASVAGVVSVKPDPDVESAQKDYSSLIPERNIDTTPLNGSTLLFPKEAAKKWIVRMERPAIGAIRKAQIVDYYVQVLMRVLRNEKDAQMCIYHVSCESNYGFCCVLDQECAQLLTAMPGVLSVEPDDNFNSYAKDYGVANDSTSQGLNLTGDIRTKKIFVTGLSFYTSEKTLRAAFEGFGDIVDVKIIIDKISKRSKGYGFLEYTTEEAAMTALKEMNGKIINGWMITVDVARMNPPKFTRTQPRPSFSRFEP